MTSHWVPFPRCSQLKRLWYSDQFTANDNNGDDNDEHTEKKKKKTENEITQADKYMFCRLHEPNENLQFMRSGIAVDFFLHIGLHFECKNDYAIYNFFVAVIFA